MRMEDGRPGTVDGGRLTPGGQPVDGSSGQPVNSFREMRIYREAFAVQQEVFTLTRQWPAGERFALTDQIRRSSRAVGANLAEAWAKRRYPAHFVGKLSDADAELQETLHWMLTAETCGYLSPETATKLRLRLELIGRRLGTMMARPEAFQTVAARPPSSVLRPPPPASRS